MESENTDHHPFNNGSDLTGELGFSRSLTILCLIVCAAGLGLLLWAVTFSEGVRRSASESRDLERIASRMLGFESRLSELSLFEQVMYRLGGQDGETEEQVRQWYEETVDEHSAPLDGLYLGILYGKAGLMNQLHQLMADWNLKKAPRLLFWQLLEAGYIHETVPVNYTVLQARLAEEVPTTWFYFQLAQRLAHQAGDLALQAHLASQFYELTELPLLRWRMLLVCEMILVGMGLYFGLRLGLGRLTNRFPQKKNELTGSRVPWTFQEGTAVLARGGALSIGLMVFVAVMPQGPSILEDYGFAFLYLPSVILASVLLCRPMHCSLLQVVGISNLWQRIKLSLPLIVMVVAIGLVGDWMIVIVGDAFQSSVHWTEWFIPQLVWGSQIELVKIAVEFILIAPLFEELIFRGILFATFRTKFSFPISMITSGLLFALVHGYGLIAFLTVFWSGCLWAWAYERTGSVIPGVFAHVVNNGLVVYSLVAFFR